MTSGPRPDTLFDSGRSYFPVSSDTEKANVGARVKGRAHHPCGRLLVVAADPGDGYTCPDCDVTGWLVPETPHPRLRPVPTSARPWRAQVLWGDGPRCRLVIDNAAAAQVIARGFWPDPDDPTRAAADPDRPQAGSLDIWDHRAWTARRTSSLADGEVRTGHGPGAVDQAAARWYLALGHDQTPVPAHGGWTPTSRNDPCGGGHPGSRYDQNGIPSCGRCGRGLDLSPCRCGDPGHEHVGRSFCSNRSRWDRQTVERLHGSREQGVRPNRTDAVRRVIVTVVAGFEGRAVSAGLHASHRGDPPDLYSEAVDRLDRLYGGFVTPPDLIAEIDAAENDSEDDADG